jgi:hypothetical protein
VKFDNSVKRREKREDRREKSEDRREKKKE